MLATGIMLQTASRRSRCPLWETGTGGLCGVTAAKLLGVEVHYCYGVGMLNRQALAREFGATNVISERGDGERIENLSIN